jgi:general secretion pathway protein D/MSHA biogenesis protein MshL
VIDRPLGLITVTAPRRIHRKVYEYLENLKKEIYKQVVIEAKIIEVRLDKSHQMGIDWSDVLQRTFTGTIEFGRLYHYEKFVKTITLNSQTFSLFMAALKTYGKTKVISNPKITLLNGHGATITVGENVTYINKVESTIDTETDVITYDVSTANILSGIGLGVMANIISDNEVILYITPLTSELQEPIEYRTFGSTAQGAQVGLPRIKIRDMATLAKVKDGQTLIIGGLIDKTKVKNENKTPFLGDLPLIGRLFTYTSEQTISRELVILLRPRIIK